MYSFHGHKTTLTQDYLTLSPKGREIVKIISKISLHQVNGVFYKYTNDEVDVLKIYEKDKKMSNPTQTHLLPLNMW